MTVVFRTKKAIFIFIEQIMALREYFILGAIGVLCVFSLAIGVEKMMKIILGNYMLIALCLAVGPTVDRATMWFSGQMPDIQQTVGFLFTNKTIITLVMYILMLILIFVKSRLHVGFHFTQSQRMLMTLLCIPMTIVSIIITLEIAVLGAKAFDPAALQTLLADVPVQGWLRWAALNTPVIVFFHALITILMSSDLKFNLPKKTYSMPDISIED
jgi:hypothetical protein